MIPKHTRIRRAKSSTKTVSEQLFEAYLETQGVVHNHELVFPGKVKHPDYPLIWNGHSVICEIKELHARRPRTNGAAMFNPYAGIRKKIQEVKNRKQFKEFKDYPCVLVLYNVDDWEFRDWPWALFGAMLGDLGLRMPFDLKTGIALIGKAQESFLDGGRMIDPRSQQAQNTTFSAIAVLSQYRPINPRFRTATKRRFERYESKHGKPPTGPARFDLSFEVLKSGIPRSLAPIPRICVFDNPLARKVLPNGLFSGSCDSRHRWNMHTRKIERLFAGDKLKRTEADESRTDLTEQVVRFRDEVVRRFQPLKIVLFGSHAYGSPEPGSDVDLLVIFPGSGDVSDRALDIRRSLDADFAMDLLTRSAGEVRRRLGMNDWFMRDVMEKGKVLYEAGNG